MKKEFLNLYNHGFARVAIGVPACKIADPTHNAAQTLALARQAEEKGAVLALFPELGLSAYTCDDLFHQHALQEACVNALRSIVEASWEMKVTMVVGLPLRVGHMLFNVAAVVSGGRILGVVPKGYLPNYGEFYEARQFSPADCATFSEIELCGQTVPFGSELIFQAQDMPLFSFFVEICEDVWVTIPPSSTAALAGATVLLNLSASNIVVGKSAYRHQLVGQQSARCVAAYMYASAGKGESSTDLAWDGQSLVYENGELLAESERFADEAHLIVADIDLERLSHDRMRATTFSQSVRHHAAAIARFRNIPFNADVLRDTVLPLDRIVERFPYVPANPAVRDERCAEVYSIQVQALVQRMTASGFKKVVLGISGGLDSTHALLVCAKAMDRMGLPRTNILGVTMPGFATGGRTLAQAHALMEAIGCTASQIDIRPSCEQMLKDIDHPYSRGVHEYDVTFENVQAGERTNHLFRIANKEHGIVVGTGDLSELALGWCTYGVGDHMSHYNVNASVPKTLIQHLVRWVAETEQLSIRNGSQVLLDILGTEISPELVPGKDGEQPEQKSESAVGPYELQDFNLYYILRYGFGPEKVAFLSHCAWSDRSVGQWPDSKHVERNEYDLAAIKKNLGIFLYRFFKISQFKRTCVPNGPKVGSGGSLSPRGDWRAPSDAEAVVWMDALARIPDAAGDNKHTK